MSDMTAGDLMALAKAAAPGSIRVGPYIVTYQGEFPYTDPSAPSGGPERNNDEHNDGSDVHGRDAGGSGEAG